MASKFSLFRTRSLPTSLPRASARFLLISVLTYAAANTAAVATALSVSTIPYGPSRTSLEQPKCQSDEYIVSLDEAGFTRLFDMSVLRFPSETGCLLENCLRGHLLNWPCVRNNARVPGDEVDDQLEGMLLDSINRAGVEGGDEKLVALIRRIYGKRSSVS